LRVDDSRPDGTGGSTTSGTAESTVEKINAEFEKKAQKALNRLKELIRFVELSKIVPCKMDARGRMTIPAAFRSLFDGVKGVEMVGHANYVEVRGI
jgi:DNA-binding transcriptional regulator/RsmH inhibitor MraZ